MKEEQKGMGFELRIGAEEICLYPVLSQQGMHSTADVVLFH